MISEFLYTMIKNMTMSEFLVHVTSFRIHSWIDLRNFAYCDLFSEFLQPIFDFRIFIYY